MKHGTSWWLVAGLALGTVVSNGFARFAYGLVLPAMRADLGWTYAQAGWINTANAIGYLLGALLALAVIRRAGAERLFVAGMFVLAIALLASGLTRDFVWLSFWRIVAGIGGAPVFVAVGALVARLFRDDPSRSALAIALSLAGGGGVGMFVSGLLVPMVLSSAALQPAWPWAWLAMGGLAALAIWPSALAVRRLQVVHPARREQPADPGPSSKSGQSFGWERPSDGEPSADTERLSGSEPSNHRARTPTVSSTASPGRAAGSPGAWAVWPALLSYGLFAAGYLAYLTFLVAWMRDLGLSILVGGLAWSALSLLVIASPFVWRAALARARAGGAMAAANLVTAAAVALPLLVPDAGGTILSAMAFGLAFFVVPTAATAFCRRFYDEAQWPSMMAVFTLVFSSGQVFGPVAAGWIADRTGDVGAGLGAAAAVLLLAALVAMVQRPRPD